MSGVSCYGVLASGVLWAARAERWSRPNLARMQIPPVDYLHLASECEPFARRILGKSPDLGPFW